MELHKTFEERLKRMLGEEYEDYRSCLSEHAYYGLRRNRLKINESAFESIVSFPMREVPWTSNGYYIEEDIQPAKHPYYHAGLYYIQEPSAMFPAQLLPVNAHDKVLDLCAAPGGKTTELAGKLDGTGLLVSNDISSSRAKAIVKNIELAGVRNAVVTCESPDKLLSCFPCYFDKILVDAPCSGEGMFRKDPSMIKNWKEESPYEYSVLQKQIILSAAGMLKPGGLLVYSTCTFSYEENEEVIQHLLKTIPEFTICSIPDLYEGFCSGRNDFEDGQDELKECVRLWPHKIQGEGHFVALLQKGESKTCGLESHNRELIEVQKNTKLPSEVIDFLKGISIDFDNTRLHIINDKVYYLPEGMPNVRGLRILRSGLYLGDIKKNRFEPSQALASALIFDEYAFALNLPAGDGRVIRYLKGETITLDEDRGSGWCLVCVDGYSLGWGKASGTALKNKYSPGWRWL